MIPWLVPQSNHQAAEVVVEGPLVEHHHHLFHYVVKVLVLYKILMTCRNVDLYHLVIALPKEGNKHGDKCMVLTRHG